jgi:hypothetical protein
MMLTVFQDDDSTIGRPCRGRWVLLVGPSSGMAQKLCLGVRDLVEAGVLGAYEPLAPMAGSPRGKPKGGAGGAGVLQS